MATTRIQLPHEERFITWFSDFLRKELAPYPGRGAIVARTVIAATITAILIVTFRIPGGVIGVLCAFIFSRENLISTTKSALNFVFAFGIGGLFIPIGARFFASVPFTHFLWEAVSLFIIFFLLRTLTNFAVATGLSLIGTNILAIWYLPGPAQRNVELTLWQVASALIGAIVTLAVEAVFNAIYPRDEVLEGVEVRLEQIEKLMRSYAADQPISPDNARLLAQYAVIGVGALRRYLARVTDEPIHRMRMTTLVSITGRSVDFAAALATTVLSYDPTERPRTAVLAERIAQIRESLRTKGQVAPWESPAERERTPILSGLEAMVAPMPSVFSSNTSIDPRLEILEAPTSTSRIFVEDAFTNPEHLRYVLSGTLAAMLCYILYVGLNWPGISTAVTTCVLTALTNIGASRQKQVLRVAGAILGGFVFGMGAQVFVLPNIDSITGFAILFASVTAIAAWVSTASSRLSYAGLQIALAFYLINLSEFSIQTSLSVARDRAIGVLLGTSMMWLVFERFYPRPAADEMVRIFIRNLRLMAEFVSFSSPAGDDTALIVKIRRLREQIYRYFGDVNAQADAVPFETGPARAGHLAARDRIRRWQTALRTFYLLEAPLIQFRLFADARGKSSLFVQIETDFRAECSRAFSQIADCLESQLDNQAYARVGPCGLQALLAASLPEDTRDFSEREIALLGISRRIASLVDRMQSEVAAEALYATD